MAILVKWANREASLEVEGEVCPEAAWLRLLEERIAKRLEIEGRIARIRQVTTPQGYRNVGETYAEASTERHVGILMMLILRVPVDRAIAT